MYLNNKIYFELNCNFKSKIPASVVLCIACLPQVL